MTRQVVEPRFRGFLSINAHPEGCAANVERNVTLIESGAAPGELGAALVVGSSTGYGLSSALAACFGYAADTLGVCFEKPSDGRRTASAGWYNVAAAHRLARERGRSLETLNGDAFAEELKDRAVERLRASGRPVDLLVYSLAAPRRARPDGGFWQSVLKPIGQPFTSKTIDLRNETVGEVTIEPASDEEIEGTVKVMGGEDWRAWVERLRREGLLAEGFRTVAYSYIGPDLTYPIYRNGTIGRAKEDLEAAARAMDAELARACNGHAWVSVNKAVVTQASAAIPVVPLYISLLFKVMKEQGTHETVPEQIGRLFSDHLGPGAEPRLDAEGRIRLDDLEMADDVQQAVRRAWAEVDTANLREVSDYDGYVTSFRRLFGFEVDGVDYGRETEIELDW